MKYKPEDHLQKQLAESFLKLQNRQDVLNYLRDLMTPAEIREFSKRLEIARLLKKGKLPCLEISEKLGVSTTTVTRVAQWLNNGCEGYQTVLKK
ncbi:helix-turn-helix domain-containing protein [Candidatus Roizmanbacteria bacterium]|nr:MAG: helix-turn-helix domain-containing protein [Candidatus Roizmanbacteria bacterium]